MNHMFLRFISSLLILAFSWQSLAYAGFAAIAAHDAEKQHEMLHFKGVAHHHDEHSESFHVDDSTASTHHVLSDAGQFSPVLPSPHGSFFALLRPEKPLIDHLPGRVWLLPDGLDRPPKPLT